MSWTPTDEQVEKAMVAIAEGGVGWQPGVIQAARAVLVAVGPMIAAQALRDAAAMQDEESARIREAYRQHNAIRDPNRPPRRPDLNVYIIEKEAGR